MRVCSSRSATVQTPATSATGSRWDRRRPRSSLDVVRRRLPPDPCGAGQPPDLQLLRRAPLIVDERVYGHLTLSRYEVRPFEHSARPHRASVRRTSGDRHQQREPVHAARGADPHRRGGQRRQGFVPRHDEPRDPHADERRDRDERAAARHRPVSRASASSPRSSAPSGESLLGIINDILDFSKIDAGRLELETHPFDLRACVESAFDLVTEPAARKGLELAFLIDPALPRRRERRRHSASARCS